VLGKHDDDDDDELTIIMIIIISIIIIIIIIIIISITIIIPSRSLTRPTYLLTARVHPGEVEPIYKT